MSRPATHMGSAARGIASLAPAAAGVGLLLLRPALTGCARWSVSALAAVYLVVLGLSLGAMAVARVETASDPAGLEPDQIALASKLTMTGLLLIYVILCVRSFIAARRARLV